jgi:hypothetical protein
VAAREKRRPHAGAGLVLLPPKANEDQNSPAAYLLPQRTALIDRNDGHVNIVVRESDYLALKRGHREFAARDAIEQEPDGQLNCKSEIAMSYRRSAAQTPGTSRWCWRSPAWADDFGTGWTSDWSSPKAAAAFLAFLESEFPDSRGYSIFGDLRRRIGTASKA